MRPVLNPALRLIWRDATTLQLGVDPRHSVVLDGLTAHGETVLALLDGTHDWASVLAAAAVLGVERADAERLLDLLLRAGALEDTAVAAPLPARARLRLAPEAGELSLHGPPGSSAAALADRGRATVVVAGCGRLGTAIGVLLAAAGVGRLLLRDELDAGPSDVPGGASPAVLGAPRVLAAAAAVQRAGEADVDAAVRRPSAEDCADADVVVVAGDLHSAADSALVSLLNGEGVSWLLAGIRETCGAVGPLVRPGRTSCPRCLDLARAERDAAWPAVVAQLAATRSRRPESGSAALVSVVAGLASAETLAAIGGSAAPLCLDATLEVRVPDWSVRRRAWRPHPACGCTSTTGAIAG